mmetsp:Transcript_39005/g.69264  ORF Transcript_39005/g.69264 Transcript_39005/m.69264 type:complete len:501 (-) Transcript_39005:4-1506(-)
MILQSKSLLINGLFMVLVIAAERQWLEKASASRCAGLYAPDPLIFRVFFHYYSVAEEDRTSHHYKCRDQGYAWHPVSFRFNAFSYLLRLNSTEPDLVMKFQRSITHYINFAEDFMLCVPLLQCLEDLHGLESARSNEARCFLAPGPHCSSNDFAQNSTLKLSPEESHLLCSVLLPVFLMMRFKMVEFFWYMPAAWDDECVAGIINIGTSWQLDLIATETHHPAAFLVEPPSAAICITGGVRTFTMPQVYRSLKDNVVNSLNSRMTKLFLVINLTSSSSHSCEHRNHLSFEFQTTYSDLFAAFDALGQNLIASVEIEPGCCWPKLGNGLQYSDCFFDGITAPAIWRAKQACATQVVEYEQTYDKRFDWIMFVRPDLYWQFPIGDIRHFEHGHMYMSLHSLTDLDPRWALVPRELTSVYTSAFSLTNPDTDAHEYFCLTISEAMEIRLERQDNRSSSCDDGGPGCTLKRHLVKHNVSVKRLPLEIIDKFIKPGTTSGGCLTK